MVKCSRQVMMGVRLYFHPTLKIFIRLTFGVQFRGGAQAFERLVSVRVFVNVAAASSMVAREFVKYRSNVEREEVKRAVEKLGTMSLKKWLGKSQQVHN